MSIYRNRCIPNNSPDGLLLTPELSDELKLSVQEMTKSVVKNIPENNRDISVYTGSGGIALLFYFMWMKLGRQEMHWDMFCQFTDEAVPLLPATQPRHRRRSKITFLSGPASIYSFLIIRGHFTRDDAVVAQYISELIDLYDSRSVDCDELLYGRCGYLFALLFVNEQCGKIIPEEHIREVIGNILKSGRQRRSHEFPLLWEWHNKQYIGGAHGAAGILYVLLGARELLTDSELAEIKGTVDAICKHQGQEDCSYNFSSRPNGSLDLVQWCHGAPGIIPLLLRAAEVYRDPAYTAVAERSAECIWKYGVLKKGVGLCHGVGGNGMAFLSLYRHTGQTKYLSMAVAFGQWIAKGSPQSMEGSVFGIPDHPYSLFEGIAGGVWFLVNLLFDPKNPMFPSMDTR